MTSIEMSCAEIIKVVSEAVMAAFTVALFYATLVLAKRTKSLDDHELERNRVRELERCIRLAQEIVGPIPNDRVAWAIHIYDGGLTIRVNELLALNKYIHDADTKRKLEVVASRFTTSLLKAENPLFKDEQLADIFLKLYEGLAQEIIEWQRDLGSYIRRSS